MHAQHLRRTQHDKDRKLTNSEELDASNARFALWMIIAVVIVIADQLTKWAIIEWIPIARLARRGRGYDGACVSALDRIPPP